MPRRSAVVDLVPLTLPWSLDIAHNDGEAVREVEEEHRGQTLCEHVGELPHTWNVHDTKLSNGDLLSDKMDVKLNVLGLRMVDQVPRHVNRRYVVIESQGRGWNLAEEIAKEVAQPRACRDNIGNDAVLGFGTQS